MGIPLNPITNGLTSDDTAMRTQLAAFDDATAAMAQTREFGKHLTLG